MVELGIIVTLTYKKGSAREASVRLASQPLGKGKTQWSEDLRRILLLYRSPGHPTTTYPEHDHSLWYTDCARIYHIPVTIWIPVTIPLQWHYLISI